MAQSKECGVCGEVRTEFDPRMYPAICTECAATIRGSKGSVVFSGTLRDLEGER